MSWQLTCNLISLSIINSATLQLLFQIYICSSLHAGLHCCTVTGVCVTAAGFQHTNTHTHTHTHTLPSAQREREKLSDRLDCVWHHVTCDRRASVSRDATVDVCEQLWTNQFVSEQTFVRKKSSEKSVFNSYVRKSDGVFSSHTIIR